MKTSSNTLDCLNANPQQSTEHDLTDKNSSEKAGSDFVEEDHDSKISLNQIFNLKKNLTFLITLAITLTAFLMSACEDEPEYYRTSPATLPYPNPMVIRNMYPSAGEPGSTVTIYGENFGSSDSNNYVAFDSANAEIIYITYEAINVRVPMDIPEGDYKITVTSNGQTADAPRKFSVIKDTN